MPMTVSYLLDGNRSFLCIYLMYVPGYIYVMHSAYLGVTGQGQSSFSTHPHFSFAQFLKGGFIHRSLYQGELGFSV